MQKFKSRFHITGTGFTHPPRLLTNEDMTQFFETSDEWITRRTGIKQRYHLDKYEEFANSQYATEAAQKALNMAKIKPEELDVIVLGTLTPDCVLPSTAVLVQNNLKAKNAFAFDVSAACSGFVLSLELAANYIAQKRVKKALIIGSEMLTRYCTYKQRNTDVIFADGSGAAVIEATTGEAGLLACTSGSDYEFWQSIYIPGHSGPRPQTVNLDGKTVFKQAVKHMGEGTLKVLVETDTPIGKVDHFIYHQANVRIIEAIVEKLNLPKEKVYSNIHKYGNTSAASVPILLDELNREGKIKKGNLIVLSALGSGLFHETLLIKW
ncbi:MAG: ketoacyl-ACP synthase III [Deltaproteobacteria bacterium]|nr:ketoacyl-ACP synthase III [Deltaproteobacteria bacterium]